MHISVLLNEAIEYLNLNDGSIVVDCTLGYAGHSSKILKKIVNGKLYAFDQDDEAIKSSDMKLSKIGTNYEIIKSNFVNIKEELHKRSISSVDGILYDLGVSSPQLDEDYRGFSFHKDAILDMRMDLNNPLTAKKVVNEYSKEDLIRIFREYGEEKYASSIAAGIVNYRKNKEIETTAYVPQTSQVTSALTQQQAQIAKQQAEVARQQAEVARQQAQVAQQQAQVARQQTQTTQYVPTEPMEQQNMVDITPTATDLAGQPLKQEEKIILDEATHRRLAQESIAKGDIYSAVAMYDNVVDDDPANPTNYIDRANLKLKVDDFDGAVRDAEMALRIGQTERGEALFTQAQAYEGKGNDVLAYRAYSVALRDDPNNYEYLYHFAKTAYNLGRYGEAQDAINTVIEHVPAEYKDAYLVSGKTRYRRADYYSAISDLTKYLSDKEFKKDASAYYYRGLSKVALKNYENAIEDFDKAIHYDSKNLNYRTMRARTYEAMGKNGNAASDFKKIVSLKRGGAETKDHLRVAEAAVRNGNYNEALVYYNIMIKENEWDSDAYLDRARLHQKMGHNYEAINDYTAALRLDPSKKVVYKERGILFVDTKAFRRAILDLNEALTLEPNNGKLYYYRAIAKQYHGDHEEAEVDFSMAKRYGENL